MQSGKASLGALLSQILATRRMELLSTLLPVVLKLIQQIRILTQG